MVDDLVISGLAKRRAALSGEILQIEKQLKRKLLDLRTLDAAIRVLNADYPIDAIKPKGIHSSDWATRGEMTRLILDILRQSPEPLSARDIAIQVMTHKQMDVRRTSTVVTMRRRVGNALRKQRRNGHLHCHAKPGYPLTWAMMI